MIDETSRKTTRLDRTSWVVDWGVFQSDSRCLRRNEARLRHGVITARRWRLATDSASANGRRRREATINNSCKHATVQYTTYCSVDIAAHLGTSPVSQGLRFSTLWCRRQTLCAYWKNIYDTIRYDTVYLKSHTHTLFNEVWRPLRLDWYKRIQTMLQNYEITKYKMQWIM